jgi:hypothetical protein
MWERCRPPDLEFDGKKMNCAVSKFTPGVRAPSTHGIRDWVGLRTFLDAGANRRTSSLLLEGIKTQVVQSLYWLSYPGCVTVTIQRHHINVAENGFSAMLSGTGRDPCTPGVEVESEPQKTDSRYVWPPTQDLPWTRRTRDSCYTLLVFVVFQIIIIWFKARRINS